MFGRFSNLGDNDFSPLSQTVAAVDALLLRRRIPSLKQKLETEKTYFCRKWNKCCFSQNVQDPWEKRGRQQLG